MYERGYFPVCSIFSHRLRHFRIYFLCPNLPKRIIAPIKPSASAAAGGFLSWLVFLFGKSLWGSVFLPALLAGFIADVYAEILARICKETSTSFFVTSVIPLIPGSTLYYCKSSIVEGNPMQALKYGRDTFLFAFGIAAGMSIAWAICYFLRSVKAR